MTSTHYSPATHYIGLDLGQAYDHTAIAVLERTEIYLGQSPVTFERITESGGAMSLRLRPLRGRSASSAAR